MDTAPDDPREDREDDLRDAADRDGRERADAVPLTAPPVARRTASASSRLLILDRPGIPRSRAIAYSSWRPTSAAPSVPPRLEPARDLTVLPAGLVAGLAARARRGERTGALSVRPPTPCSSRPTRPTCWTTSVHAT
ncbi:hypothetical protein Arub01_56020 [Actinomadura rubrobrunea]|uniref:Uncharacterized protein n=1 Tax=Actinomadura rubrobrunea TaxID=115335 RepID=A0A9W6Q2E7_9ACTN|nr:hypothetical protein Arub01_56020 [Actinomadura rubrobrunea]